MGRTACTEPRCLYSRAIPLLPVWAVRPVQSLGACTVELYLYYLYGPYGLYRASVPVQGWPLPFYFLNTPDISTHQSPYLNYTIKFSNNSLVLLRTFHKFKIKATFVKMIFFSWESIRLCAFKRPNARLVIYIILWFKWLFAFFSLRGLKIYSKRIFVRFSLGHKALGWGFYSQNTGFWPVIINPQIFTTCYFTYHRHYAYLATDRTFKGA
jgi:hypothetical protein